MINIRLLLLTLTCPLLPQLSNISSFAFNLDEIRSEFGEDISNSELHMEAWIYDWYWMEQSNGTAVTQIHKDGVYVTALGNKFRPFKPNADLEIVVSVALLLNNGAL